MEEEEEEEEREGEEEGGRDLFYDKGGRKGRRIKEPGCVCTDALGL